MHIKIESTVKGIECGALLTIESPTENPAVGLKVEEARSLINNTWQVDPAKAKQVVTFVGEDGPVELIGVLPTEQAVEVAAAYKVVLQTEVSTTALPAYEAGKKSRTLLAISVRRVVEVWTTSKRCAWRAADAAPAAPGGRTMDMSTGKIAAAA